MPTEDWHSGWREDGRERRTGAPRLQCPQVPPGALVRNSYSQDLGERIAPFTSVPGVLIVVDWVTVERH